MANPHKLAVDSGIRANDTIGTFFTRIGTAEHPRGFVVSSYRNANRALKTAIGEPSPILAVSEVINELRRTVKSDSDSMLTEAQGSGIEEAARQLRIYGVKTSPPSVSTDTAERQAVVDAIISRIDAQEAAIRAMLMTGADPSQIVGDEERKGILKDSDITALLAAWAASLFWTAFTGWADAHQGSIGFQKQAVAALDARTTDCCLRVHGQIQPMNKPFHLTGMPRFADYMDWPGFHWWCRTSGVLVPPDSEDELTATMRSDARYWLEERAKGNNPDQHPANAIIE